MHFEYIGLPFQDWHSPRSCIAPIIAVGVGASTTRKKPHKRAVVGASPYMHPPLNPQHLGENHGSESGYPSQKKPYGTRRVAFFRFDNDEEPLRCHAAPKPWSGSNRRNVFSNHLAILIG